MATKTAHRSSDLAIPLGELLQEELEARGMTQKDLSRETHRPPQAINEIIRGRKRITPETALDLERALGTPASFWLNLESNFQLAKARLRRS
ncbi:MAG: HigA family addiction module antidote protein [Chloroflexi bacterium]|nr:HigA family addiction module antidote protein [Chloroflexota bacterium]